MAVPLKTDFFQNRKETLLIINGGGLKIAGVAIGMLKVLDKYFKEKRIEIDRVVGVSGGSVIAASYALGYSPAQITKIILHSWTPDLFSDFNLFPLSGILKGEKIEAIMKWGFASKKFSETKIPLSIVVSKFGFLYAKPVIINDGYIHEAVRASIAIPGFLKPKKIKGKWYYDGGVTSTSAREICGLFNAKEVYFLNILPERLSGLEQLLEFFHVLFRNRVFSSNAILREKSKDVKIHEMTLPIYEKIHIWETEYMPFLILEGEKFSASFLKKSPYNYNYET